MTTNKQALGKTLAGAVFLAIAVVAFTRDSDFSSVIGIVFLVEAAVFLGLASSAWRK